MSRTLTAFLASCLVVGAQAQSPAELPCAEGDAKCAREAALRSPVRKKSYWSDALAKPVEQRIGAAPAELVTFLNLDNMADGIGNRPHAPSPADFVSPAPTILPPKLQKAGEEIKKMMASSIFDHLMADTKAALADLPPEIRVLFDKKLAGIYFVYDLGGTGYTDYAKGGWFSRDAGFIVLDTKELRQRSANEWATWKENTPFKDDPAFRLEARIETDANDNRKNAIQYILLHELGHVLSIGEDVHPRWDLPPNDDASLDAYPFANLSWQIDAANNQYASRFDAAFPTRKDVVYYFGAKLDGSAMVAAYDQLLKTNFPTLYATTRPGDDFAESFASYVHTVIMKRPWEIRILQDGKPVRVIGSCWEEKRCAEKRKVLESFLGIKAN